MMMSLSARSRSLFTSLHRGPGSASYSLCRSSLTPPRTRYPLRSPTVPSPSATHHARAFSSTQQTCLSNIIASHTTLSASDPAATVDGSPIPRIIVSGIQSTGIPHLGNYFGTLTSWVDLQNSAPPCDQLFFFLADLHSLTSRPGANELAKWRRETVAALMAIGIGQPESQPHRHSPALNADTGLTATTGIGPSVALFCQSQVPAHAELNWILACHASVGYLSRMTQWKSKLSTTIAEQPQKSDTLSSASPPSSISSIDATQLLNPNSGSTDAAEALRLGLFAYPVLQAADVLVYRATHVPVGPDQAQHLEFARELAVAFNNSVIKMRQQEEEEQQKLVKGGQKTKKVPTDTSILVPPETILAQHESAQSSSSSSSSSDGAAVKIKSLTDPTRKMSKSQGPERSRIFITDSPELIKKKIKMAVTDSQEGPITYDPINRPGVSNLIDLLVLIRNTEIQQRYRHDQQATALASSSSSLSSALKSPPGELEVLAHPELIDIATFVATEIPPDMTLGGLKAMLTHSLIEHLTPIRERYRYLIDTPAGQVEIRDVIQRGGEKARRLAGEVMADVWDAIGIRSI